MLNDINKNVMVGLKKLRVRNRKIFFLFLNQNTQKNSLNETVHLSTQNMC